MAPEKRRLLSYILLLCAMLATAALLVKLNAQSNRPFHTNITAISAMASMFAGLLSLVRYYAKNNCPYLWIGLAFFGNSIIEIIYVYNFSFFPLFRTGDLDNFMVRGWWTGRMYLSIMLLGSFWTCRDKPIINDKLAYGVAIPLFVVLVLFLLSDIHLSISSSIVSRPLEFIPAGLFIIAMVGYYRRSMWKQAEFYHWIILSLIITSSVQLLIIPFSRKIYDTQFMYANVFRAISQLLISVGLLAEIFKLYRAAQEETRRLNMLRLMVNQINDYALFMIDTTGHIATWNKGAENIKGYTADEIIGKHFSQFYPDEDNIAGKPAMELREAIKKGHYLDEGWRIKKDGSRFWAYVLISPVYREDGELLGFSKVTRDLTERKMAEEELRRKNELLTQANERLNALRLMVNQIRDYALFMIDPKGHIMSWNKGAEHIIGYTADEIIGKHFSQFYPEEDKKAGKPAMELREAIKQGSYLDEGWRLKKDGSRFWAYVLITPVYNDGGELLGFSKVTRDLTERKMAEEELRRRNALLTQSNEELQQFAYIATHDLKEPLRSINSFTELIVRDCKNVNDRATTYSDIIGKSTRRLAKLIDDLRTYTIVGKQGAEYEKVDMSQCLEDALNMLKKKLDESNAHIHVKKMPVVIGSSSQFTYLFFHFIDNGIKYAKPGITADISIACEEGDTEYIFSVADNGIGIPKEYETKIFTIFRRLQSREKGEGSGIGLSICKKVILLYGGKIWFHSNEHGTTFYFSLPKNPTPLISSPGLSIQS